LPDCGDARLQITGLAIAATHADGDASQQALVVAGQERLGIGARRQRHFGRRHRDGDIVAEMPGRVLQENLRGVFGRTRVRGAARKQQQCREQTSRADSIRNHFCMPSAARSPGVGADGGIVTSASVGKRCGPRASELNAKTRSVCPIGSPPPRVFSIPNFHR